MATSDLVKNDASLKKILERKNNKFILTEYFNPLEELYSLQESIKTSSDVITRGKAWALLGYIQSFIFGNIGYVDRVFKVKLKLKRVMEDIEDCEHYLNTCTLEAKIAGSYGDHKLKPRFSEMSKMLKASISLKEDLSSFNAVRPGDVEFRSVFREFSNFRISLGSFGTLKKLLRKLTEENSIKEAEIWLESVGRFMDNIESKFLSGYPDIVYPVLVGLAQIRHGMELLINETRREIWLKEKGQSDNLAIESFIHNLVRFPTLGPKQENLLNLVHLCTSRINREFIGGVICGQER